MASENLNHFLNDVDIIWCKGSPTKKNSFPNIDLTKVVIAAGPNGYKKVTSWFEGKEKAQFYHTIILNCFMGDCTFASMRGKQTTFITKF